MTKSKDMNTKKDLEETTARAERLEAELRELRAAQKTLEAREKKYRRMFESASEYLYCHDLEGRFTDINVAVRRAGGYSGKELLGRKIKEMLEEKVRDEFDAYLERILHQGEDKGLIRAIGKDGNIRILEYRNRLVHDGGKPAYVQGIAQDITERLRTEKSLREGEERYRTILESIEEGYYEVDLSGNFTFFNDSVCRLTGYTRQELTGMNNRQYMDPEVAGKVYRAFSRVYRTGQADKGLDWILQRKDGTPVQIEASVSLIRDEKGKKTGFRGIVRDITERKRIEEEIRRHRDHLEDLVEDRARELLAANELLRRQVEERRRAEKELSRSREEYRDLYESSLQREEVYRSLLHSSADAIVLYDLEGRTRYVSPSFTRTFGWGLEELEGRPLPYVPEGEKDRTEARLRTLIEQGEPIQGFETRRHTKDGRILDVSISTSRYDDHEGRPAGLLMILRDITENRKLQAQLQHAQRMESIGTIASGVGHNFRNILAGISVNSQLLQMKYGEDPELSELARRMNHYVKRGSSLVEGLMQFARKRRGSGFRRVDLVGVLQETCDLIRQSFDRKIEIRMSLPDSLPILGDDPALRQVFMNLCTNARDAMPDGGVLSIRAESSGDRAEVEIEDTGEGMNPETQKKCFDPFFTTKEMHQGTGLGLSTSYGIVQNHGGEVSLYSVPGRGTRFRLHLPLAVIQEEVGDTEEEIHIPYHGKGRKILVVDDEESMLSALSDLLESLGYVVVTAPGVLESLKVYQSQAPELVLMDRNMPGMDGITGMKELLRMDPKARVVLISGYDEKGPHGIDESTRQMLAGYITKPVDVVELSLALGRIFEKDESA